MTLWRRTRNEVAGAWRSLRYDLGRHEPDADEASPRAGAERDAGYPDVTSTGLSTFSGSGVTGGLRTSYGEEQVFRPRRLAAVSAFGALAVAGAAGSYFAVVNGVGSLLGDEPAGTEPYPLAAEAPRGGDGELSNSGLGRGTAVLPGRPAAAATSETAPGRIRVLPTSPSTTPSVPGRPQPRPRQTTVEGTTPATGPTACDCLTPPVPTPTAPVPTPHSPSATPSPSATSHESGSPRPSESPSSTDPGVSGSGGGTGERLAGARHARGY
jgi:hypothetical protein